MAFDFGDMMARAGVAESKYMDFQERQNQLQLQQMQIEEAKNEMEKRKFQQQAFAAAAADERAYNSLKAGRDAVDQPKAGTIPYYDRQIQDIQSQIDRTNRVEKNLMSRGVELPKERTVEREKLMNDLNVLQQQRNTIASKHNEDIYKDLTMLKESPYETPADKRDATEKIIDKLKSQGASPDEIGQIRRGLYNPKLSGQYLDALIDKYSSQQEIAEKHRVEYEKQRLMIEKAAAQAKLAGKEPTAAPDIESATSLVMQGETSVGKKADMPRVVSKIKEDHPWLNSYEVGKNIETAKNLNAGIKHAEQNRIRLEAFENTTIKNIDAYETEIDKLKATDTVDLPAVNQFLYNIKNMTGEVTTQAAEVYGKEAANEAAKLASSATAAGTGGTLTDREEWEKFFKPGSSYDQIKERLRAVRQSVSNRTDSMRESISSTQEQIDNLWKHPSEKKETKPSGKAMTLDEYLKKQGY